MPLSITFVQKKQEKSQKLIGLIIFRPNPHLYWVCWDTQFGNQPTIDFLYLLGLTPKYSLNELAK